MYEQLAQTCVPAATNVGVFWPRHGLLRKRGLAVVEFLEPIQPGMESDAFMAHLQETVEGQSNVLMQDAGFEIESDVSLDSLIDREQIREGFALDDAGSGVMKSLEELRPATEKSG